MYSAGAVTASCCYRVWHEQLQPPRACHLQEGACACGRRGPRLSGAVNARALGWRLAIVAAVLRAIHIRSGLTHHMVSLVSTVEDIISRTCPNLPFACDKGGAQSTLVHACRISAFSAP